MNNSTDDLESSSYIGSYAEKHFSIPLMNKKQNTIEKYVSSYKIVPNRLKDTNLQHRRADSMLSSNGSRLVYGGKFTPDDRVVAISDDKSYVKYSPLKDERTE